MSQDKIAIVNSSSFGKYFPDHITRLEKIGEVNYFEFDHDISGEDLGNNLKDYSIIIASVTPFYTKEFFNNIDGLKLITRHGIGYNNIDIEAASDSGTVISIVPALVERDAVAEQNVSNILSVMRKVVQSSEGVRDNRWEDRAEFVGNSLFNKTVGVIGIGNIGSAIAEVLRLGFRCDVIAYDPNKDQMYMDQFGAKKVNLEELLKLSDAIFLSANLTEDNYHMISYSEIDKMKDNVYISNSARGALIKEEAIIDGLKSKKIAGFASDVLEKEPGRSDHPYLEFENVVLTPHTGAYTIECLEKMGDKCVTDVEKIVSGNLPERAIQKMSNYIE